MVEIILLVDFVIAVEWSFYPPSFINRFSLITAVSVSHRSMLYVNKDWGVQLVLLFVKYKKKINSFLRKNISIKKSYIRPSMNRVQHINGIHLLLIEEDLLLIKCTKNSKYR